ncbi:MAG: aromatic amino acid transport family protein [Patescibacteria group bacterium]
MRIHRELDSLGLLVGTIIGAGMFVLPYATAQAGIVWAGIYLVVVTVLMFFLHTLYGEAVYILDGNHRLPGYARLHLGRTSSYLATFSLFFGFIAALLAYGILGGEFLHVLARAGDASYYVFAFFIIGAFGLLLNLERIGWIAFLLTIPLVFFILVLAALAFPHIEWTRIPIMNNAKWFLPYGIFLFATSGVSTIPEIAQVLQKKQGRVFEKIVLLSGGLVAFLYAVFIVSVVGVTGAGTTTEAVEGLVESLGPSVVIIGALIGFLAVARAYLAIGLDFRNTLMYDFSVTKARAWVMVVTLPVGLYMMGAKNLIDIISTAGGIMGGLDAIVILLLAIHVRKHKTHPRGFIPVGILVPKILIAVFVVGIFYQVLYALGAV